MLLVLTMLTFMMAEASQGARRLKNRKAAVLGSQATPDVP